jgi:hypothetical protein
VGSYIKGVGKLRSWAIRYPWRYSIITGLVTSLAVFLGELGSGIALGRAAFVGGGVGLVAFLFGVLIGTGAHRRERSN